MKNLVLWHYPLTRSVRVLWLLHELGLKEGEDFVVKHVQLTKGAMQLPENREVNPNAALPVLQYTDTQGNQQVMLESGAIVLLLADVMRSHTQLSPPPSTDFSVSRADYLQMLFFTTVHMDTLLWQLRLHLDLLPSGSGAIVARARQKWQSEIIPQLAARLTKHPYICGPTFTAADVVLGHNLGWARKPSYGLRQMIEQETVIRDYLARLRTRSAYVKAYADATDFKDVKPGGYSASKL
eukprot:gb/GEZN01010849.1/.p1 GENE.gb/GEZN01010849.1/~~gb/GEZN01010849.1/.p1  ORF type:complete len:239 (+),score=14.21 gb/GEZN01010849.1/:50-766(+)